jgi:uncharacterized protein (TIGR03067 family)
MHRLFGVLLVLTTPLLLTAADDDKDKELKSLQGKWKAIGLEAGGKPLPKDSVPEFLFTVGAKGKSTGQMGKREYQSQLSVDPKKSPKTIDNLHESGLFKGQKQVGIYKIEGGKWIVCMSAPGVAEGDRPKTFETKGTGNRVFTFEKVKDEKRP